MFTALILSAFLQINSTAPRPIVWDYTDAQLKADGVNRFEMCVATQATFDVACAERSPEWKDVGRVRADDADQTPGTVTYKATVPPLAQGPHTVAVRACNPTECSEPLSLSFVVSIKPGPVTKLRIGGGG